MTAHEVRPWGTFLVLIDEPTHKVKTITVKAGHRLSLQSHKYRDERWIHVSGEGIVTLGFVEMPELTQRPFDEVQHAVFIPKRTIHRVEAGPHQDLIFIEVQVGTYFGEDDIIRYEDDYGRK